MEDTNVDIKIEIKDTKTRDKIIQEKIVEDLLIKDQTFNRHKHQNKINRMDRLQLNNKMDNKDNKDKIVIITTEDITTTKIINQDNIRTIIKTCSNSIEEDHITTKIDNSKEDSSNKISITIDNNHKTQTKQPQLKIHNSNNPLKILLFQVLLSHHKWLKV